MKSRLPKWEEWHKNTTPLNYVRSTENQIEQSKSISSITKLSSIDGCSVIEIGPADGGTAKHLLENNKNIKNYTLVDDLTMLNNCKDNLSEFNFIKYVPIDSLKEIENNNYDILISNHCLEETPKEYQEYIYKTFFPNVNEVFILCNTEHSDMWGEFNSDYLKDSLNNYFNSVNVLPGHKLSRDNQKIFYANNYE